MLNGFKDFILRGNVISMAIGLAVGAAFTAVVTAFSNAFILPLIGLFTRGTGDFSKASYSVDGVTFPYGLFISAAIAFLITAAVLYFLVVLPMAKVQNRFTAKAEEKAADIKAALRDCPQCFSEIPSVASRCAHCTCEVEPDAEARALAGLPAQR
ncbi:MULTISPECIES: large conductance mechanosensitive channel protein MscL [unclassified Streptomyces]|uniref:large conductance mechanosensitive channel protein MscL n=1 Tax=unclassified Streptomyces TaxID=2593676 RepID=UPI002E332B0D|nr:large conductance mechanosensitive channel protein MscL [Streptomyces sp. NBC_01460]WSS27465.1 large conductance mechanosensitive channel protein MscL [Streptomyces sp. NBC_01185]